MTQTPLLQVAFHRTESAGAIKRRLVLRARRSLLNCRAVTLTDVKHRELEYFIVRDDHFKRAIAGLWGLGYQTDQIAIFIDDAVTEGMILATLRSFLAAGHTLLLNFLITGDLLGTN